MSPRARRNATRFDLDLRFQTAVHRIPPAARPTLLTWLQRYRRRPHRIFWALDPATGRWRRLKDGMSPTMLPSKTGSQTKSAGQTITASVDLERVQSLEVV